MAIGSPRHGLMVPMMVLSLPSSPDKCIGAKHPIWWPSICHTAGWVGGWPSLLTPHKQPTPPIPRSQPKTSQSPPSSPSLHFPSHPQETHRHPLLFKTTTTHWQEKWKPVDKCHDHPGCGDRIFTALDSLCSAVKPVGHNLLRGQTADAGCSDWTLLSLYRKVVVVSYR